MYYKGLHMNSNYYTMPRNIMGREWLIKYADIAIEAQRK